MDDDDDDSDNDFWSDEEDDVKMENDKKIDKYELYKYSVSESRADFKSSYEVKDLAIRKLQYVTVS